MALALIFQTRFTGFGSPILKACWTHKSEIEPSNYDSDRRSALKMRHSDWFESWTAQKNCVRVWVQYHVPHVSATFTTIAFDDSNLWLFEASPYRAAPKGQPSSLVQHDAFASS
jgi:hypothetical protein